MRRESRGAGANQCEVGGAPQERRLALDETMRIPPRPQGVELRALEGCLVVTRSGDPEDHVLERGDVLRLPGSGLVVVWALAPSRLEVKAAVSPADPASSRARVASSGSRAPPRHAT